MRLLFLILAISLSATFSLAAQDKFQRTLFRQCQVFAPDSEEVLEILPARSKVTITIHSQNFYGVETEKGAGLINKSCFRFAEQNYPVLDSREYKVKDIDEPEKQNKIFLPILTRSLLRLRPISYFNGDGSFAMLRGVQLPGNFYWLGAERLSPASPDGRHFSFSNVSLIEMFFTPVVKGIGLTVEFIKATSENDLTPVAGFATSFKWQLVNLQCTTLATLGIAMPAEDGAKVVSLNSCAFPDSAWSLRLNYLGSLDPDHLIRTTADLRVHYEFYKNTDVVLSNLYTEKLGKVVNQIGLGFEVRGF